MATQEVFLGLGSNIGDTKNNLEKACNMLNTEVGHISSLSSFYTTKPWGKTDQEDFLNQVIRIFTDLGPQTLLHKIQKIEQELGRVKGEKWGPRSIDIDILYYGQMVLDIEDLQLPHQELTERKFVLVPLAEVAPDFVHPIFKLSNRELLDYCQDSLEVVKC